jgi:hypothetical protein
MSTIFVVSLFLINADFPVCIIDSCQIDPTAIYAFGQYYAFWVDHRGTPNAIYGARVSTNGTVIDPDGIEIVTGAVNVAKTRVASDGTRLLIVHGSG